MTIASPMGKTAAVASLPPTVPAMDAATPAKAMNAPAKTPKTSIFPRLCPTLFSTPAQYSAAASANVRSIFSPPFSVFFLIITEVILGCNSPFFVVEFPL